MVYRSQWTIRVNAEIGLSSLSIIINVALGIYF